MKTTLDNNALTLETYNAKADVYEETSPTTVKGFLKNWLDDLLETLPANAKITEIGSATGRDALYMRNRGFNPLCTDAVGAFLNTLTGHGLEVEKFNALQDEFPRTNQDLIYANAVLLHFTPEQNRDLLERAHAALTDGGKIAFTLKFGSGESWVTSELDAPRYFHHYDPAEVVEMLLTAGYKDVYMKCDASAYPSHGLAWLHLIATK